MGWWLPPSPPPAPLEPGQEALPAPASAEGSAPVFAKIDPESRPEIAPVPGGDACVSLLAQRGVAFSRRQGERGVATPVLVNGPIGGVKFFSDATPFIADCRLVLALSELAPELAEIGVSQVRFSGAYVYRVKTTGSGALSLHAYGLAIDVHDVWFGAERLNVKVNFTKGLGRECQPNLPRLNDLVCRVRERRMFKELLTPDDNADHHDHFHFGLAPLPNELPPEPPPIVLRKPVRTAAAAPVAEENQKGTIAKSKPDKAKDEKAKVEKAKVEKSKSDEPRPDKAKAEKSETPKKADADKPKPEKSKRDDGKAEKAKAEKPAAKEPKTEKSESEKPKSEKAKLEKPKSDKPVERKDDANDEIPPIESEAPGSLPEVVPDHG